MATKIICHYAPLLDLVGQRAHTPMTFQFPALRVWRINIPNIGFEILKCIQMEWLG
jgi:hypothetical protein